MYLRRAQKNKLARCSPAPLWGAIETLNSRALKSARKGLGLLSALFIISLHSSSACLSLTLQLQSSITKDDQPSDTEIRFAHLTTENGLSQNTVQCIFQDKVGFLWFGTQDGLNRYDGYSFTIFKHDALDTNTISNNFVRAIVEDRAGNLWIATQDGLNRFDPATERFTRFKHDPENGNTISANNVNALCLDRAGILWIATLDGGLNQLDRRTKKFSHFRHNSSDPQSLRHDNVVSLFEDKAATLWIGTAAGLQAIASPRREFVFHDLRDDQFRDDASNAVINICEDASGTLWLATQLGGVIAYHPRAGRFTRYSHVTTQPASLSDNRTWFAYVEHSKNLWIGTQDGLNQFNPATKDFRHYRNDPDNAFSLSHDEMYACYEDRAGTLWFGTNGGGVNQYYPLEQKFVHVSTKPGGLSSNEIWSFAEDSSGALWVGAGDGLNRLDADGHWNVFKHDPRDSKSIGHDVVTNVLIDRRGDLWAGTYGGGLSKAIRREKHGAGDSKTAFIRFRHDSKNPNSLSSDRIMTLYEDRAGAIWIGTEGGGLQKFAPSTNSFTTYKSDPADSCSLSNNIVTTIYEDRDSMLWVGTWGEGLNMLDPATQKFRRYRSDANDPNSLSNNLIQSLYEDESGNLWIGTGGGLNKLDPQRRSFTRYSENDGLPDSHIYGILADGRGNLWLSTNRGLSRFNEQARDRRGSRCKNFDTHDGLQGREFNSNAYYQSKSGEMFFGGLNGFNRFFPEQIRDNPYAPPVVLTTFRKLDQIAKLDRALSHVDHLEISYRDYFFSFEYAALDFIAPERTQYEYKLEGFDPDWVYAGAKRSVRFTNIDPGEYVFRVRAANADGVWNKEGAAVRLTIVPPFWLRWWFIAGVALALAGSFGGVVRYVAIQKLKRRVQALEREQAILQEREHTRDSIARDLHDDVASTLGSIGLYIEALRRQLRNAAPDVQTVMEKINNLALAAEEAMSDIVWSVSPRHDTLPDLLTRMRDIGMELCSTHGIDGNFHLPKEVEPIRLSDEVRKNLYLIFKEGITNAVKHAQAKSITVNATMNSGVFQMSIADDGHGFADAQESTSSPPARGHGLRNMKKRAEEISAEFSLQSTPGKGTVISLSFKMT